MNCIIEACIETLKGAVEAEKKGANRLELCGRLDVGGVTPNISLIKDVLENVEIPIRVMIRPRGGDFVYDSNEFEQMKKDIKELKKLPIEGLVFGILTEKKIVDFKRTEELVKLAKPKKIVFHKAIDDANNMVEASKKLIELGVDNILSSGGYPSALEGYEILNKMINITNDKIVVAGKVTSENLEKIKLLIKSSSYHGRKIVD